MNHTTTTQFEEFSDAADDSELDIESGAILEHTTNGDRYEVIRANPFEAYIENVETNHRTTVDARQIGGGPYIPQ